MTKSELQIMIDEMVEETINEFFIYDLHCVKKFCNLYQQAITTKKLSDINKAIDYYYKHEDEILCKKYDQDGMSDEIKELKNRIKKLEKFKKEIGSK